MADPTISIVISAKDQFSATANRVVGSLNRIQGAAGQVGRGVGQLGAGLARVGAVAARSNQRPLQPMHTAGRRA